MAGTGQLRIWHVGNWCIHIGQKYVESPFEAPSKDVEVLILNNVIDLEKFDVAFYNNDCIHPTVASDIDGLVSDLKSSFKKEIPNVTITEEK